MSLSPTTQYWLGWAFTLGVPGAILAFLVIRAAIISAEKWKRRHRW